MLIASAGAISYDPVKLRVSYRGANLDLMIRPLDALVLEACREKARSFHWAENPKTQKQELGSVVDQKTYDLALFDHVVASFSGVGSSKDRPWPVDAKHKSLLVYLAPGPDDPLPLWDVLCKAAAELARSRYEELEAELKNS